MKRKKLPSLAKLKRDCWKAFSRFVRSRAADYAGYAQCYTCGYLAPWKELQAGHAIPGRHGAVLFDLDVVRPQCVRCNVFMRGNYPVFTAKLIKENGMDWWERKWADSHKTKKITRADYLDMLDEFK